MKIDIKYSVSTFNPAYRVATAIVSNDAYTGVGKSWAEAKNALLAKIKKVFDLEVPDNETVELALKTDWPSVETQNDHWSKMITEGLI